MKKKPASKYAFFNTRVLIGLAFCLIGLVLSLVAFALYPGGNALARINQSSIQGLSLAQEPSINAQAALMADIPASGVLEEPGAVAEFASGLVLSAVPQPRARRPCRPSG